MDRGALGFRRAARVRQPARVAGGARGARPQAAAAARLALWQAKPALGACSGRAARTTRSVPMRWGILLAVAVVALVTSVVLGPAGVPLSEVLGSDIVWNLRAPRALLAFLVGGSLGV